MVIVYIINVMYIMKKLVKNILRVANIIRNKKAEEIYDLNWKKVLIIIRLEIEKCLVLIMLQLV